MPTLPPSKIGRTIAVFNRSANGWSASYAVLRKRLEVNHVIGGLPIFVDGTL